MGYLLSQIFLCLLAAFALGLLLGWLLWSRRDDAAPARDDQALATARARIASLEADLADCRATSAAAPAVATPVAAAPPAAAGGGAAAGLFGAPAETPVDDLKRISGIGPKIERQLAGIGITTFRQIATLTPDDVARVNDAIQVFQGRIEREKWIAQAQELHREDYGDDV